MSLWDMPETHAQNQSRGGGFGARRVCLRRDARRNCSPYCRTIAAAGFSRIPTPPRSSTMRTRLQCAARHPPRSIALPSVATLTRSLKTHAIMGVKRISTASVRFSQRDTRDRYLACRHPDAEALRRQSARTKPVGPRARYLLAVDVPAGTSGLAKLVKLAVEGLPIGADAEA